MAGQLDAKLAVAGEGNPGELDFEILIPLRVLDRKSNGCFAKCMAAAGLQKSLVHGPAQNPAYIKHYTAKRLMKRTIILAFIVSAVLGVSCGKKQGASGNPVPSDMSSAFSMAAVRANFTTNNQVICYGSVDTNAFPELSITVREIWKGSTEALTLGISNGMQFSYQWPLPGGGSLPDGAVVGFPQTDNPSMAFAQKGIFFVRTNYVLGVTIQNLREGL